MEIQPQVRMTAQIVSAYLSGNRLAAGSIPELIGTVHAALGEASAPAPEPETRPAPAVAISRSVQPDYIICLEDGKRLKMLKRYLRTKFGLSPEEYRRRWGLKPDYPMVAPAYAARRSDFAKSIGLGKGVRRNR